MIWVHFVEGSKYAHEASNVLILSGLGQFDILMEAVMYIFLFYLFMILNFYSHVVSQVTICLLENWVALSKI